MTTLGSGTSEFPPFATAAGANVLSPAAWAGKALRQQGFQAGLVNSVDMNTVLRKGAFIAAVLAQFIADFSGAAALDNGNLLQAEGNLVTAIQSALDPYGVYFVVDTGTANKVVGTSAIKPGAYAIPGLVIFKKMNANNTGAMQINLWGYGDLPLVDNTGAPFSTGAIRANGFYVAAYDGSQYRVLGGAATYTSVTNLTANSGDGIAVTGGGVVNRRRALGNADTNILAGDRWSRGRASDDADVYVTTTQLVTYLQGALNFLSDAPSSGPGVGIGQWLMLTVQISGSYTSPQTAGLVPGMTVSGANLSAGVISGANSYLAGVFGPNGSNAGYAASWQAPSARVNGTITGTWRLDAYSILSGVPGVVSFMLIFTRIA